MSIIQCIIIPVELVRNLVTCGDAREGK